ncbi:MAG: hypothetical protein AAGA70_05295 [Pseudomonadota bacterium]
MDITRLTRQSHRQTRPAMTLLGQFDFAGARVHEACGAARRRLALWLARGLSGPVLWIRPAWSTDRLHMAGVAAEIEPGRIILVEPQRAEDVLWSLEQALRSGAVALAVAECAVAPELTPVRRLHLAAEAGAEAGGCAPLGLLLTPGAGGARGVESRWRLEPDHGAARSGWQLERLRARTAPEGRWPVIWSNGRAQLDDQAAAIA